MKVTLEKCTDQIFYFEGNLGVVLDKIFADFDEQMSYYVIFGFKALEPSSKMLVGCRTDANCPLMGPALTGGIPPWGVFLRNPSPYLREIRRKPRKTPNG